jgi:hypothetical protein
MRKQVKFTFQVGTAKRHKDFELKVVNEVSKVCGGCTTSSKVGWWRDDGDTHANRFEGELFEEYCFELELTCEQHKAEAAYRVACNAIAMAAGLHDVDTNWVHVTETEMTGRHFSVAELLNGENLIAAE